MDNIHVFVEVIMGISLVIFISGMLYILSNRIKFLPYTVLLLVTGLLLAPLHIHSFEMVRLSTGSVLFIFLPILLFESAFNFEFREFKKVISFSFLLATVGLII